MATKYLIGRMEGSTKAFPMNVVLGEKLKLREERSDEGRHGDGSLHTAAALAVAAAIFVGAYLAHKRRQA